MKYKLDVSMTEKDYYNFNKFHMSHSPYGKRSQRSAYIIATVMALLIALMSLIIEGVTLTTMLMLFPYAIVIASILALIKPLSLLILKIQITVMKKRGKLPYSASSTLELYDDFFVEITETERREVKYTGAEGIMVAEDGSVYIYMNSLMAYILPVGTFESDEVRDEIREFLLDKVAPLK